MKIKKYNRFQAKRLIGQFKDAEIDFSEALRELLSPEKNDIEVIPDSTFKALRSQYRASQRAQEYMAGRGFTEWTTSRFDICFNGYSVGVPLRMVNGDLIGMVWRDINKKQYGSWKGMPKTKTLFNIHRTKVKSYVAVTEASFDAMMLEQNGIPAVATLGGYLSEAQKDLLTRHFDVIIVATDNDEAGRALGDSIAKSCHNKQIQWLMHNDDEVYPGGKKDICDMTSEEIQQCWKNRASQTTYNIYREKNNVSI